MNFTKLQKLQKIFAAAALAAVLLLPVLVNIALLWYYKVVRNLETIKEKAAEFAKKSDLDLLVLFGSQVSGKTHKNSDYDFGFISAQPKSFEEQVRMEFELSEILKIGKIDLVDLKKAPPLLMKNAALNSVLFYQKKSTLYATFKIYALKLFAEAKRLFEIREIAIQKFILNH